LGAGAEVGAWYPVHSYDTCSRRDGNQETNDKSPAESDTDEMDSEDSEEETRIRVSAKHLILASPWFQQCLTGSFSEAATFAEKGTVEIDVPD
jgi:hypothetical protein